MYRFLAAWQFLTIIPVPGFSQFDDRTFRDSVICFPLVGLVLGIITATAASLLLAIFPTAVAAVLTVAILLLLSGGLHMDGLADTADGFFSSRPKEKILEIMRDSRIGAMGVIGIVVVLAVKITSLSSMPPEKAVAAAVLMPVAGRCSLVFMMAYLPYVRAQTGGLATLFYESSRTLAVLIAAFVVCTSFFWVAGFKGILMSAGVVFFIVLFSLYCKRKIAGATGDTLGAGCELTEAGVCLMFSLSVL